MSTRSQWAIDYYSQHFTAEELVPNEAGECAVSCPFPGHGKGRGDSNASMSVNVFTGEFNCMAPTCHGGTEYDFEQQIAGVEAEPLGRVISRLEARLGARPSSVAVASDLSTPAIDDGEVEDRRRRLWDRYPDELEWLREARGLTDETIKEYRLGYKPADQRLSIPVYDDRGRCVNIRGHSRRGGNDAKVISYGPGYGRGRLYPIEAIVGAGGSDLLLVEGELDAIAARQAGFNAFTTTMGAGGWRDEWSVLLAGASITIAYDNDEAGRAGAEKVGRRLMAHAKEVRIADVGAEVGTPGADVTDLLLEAGGVDRLGAVVAAAMPFSGLEYSDKGELIKNERNCRLLLSTGAFAGALWHNDFSGDVEVWGALPWRASDGMTQWDDADDAQLRFWMGEHYNIRSSKMLEDAVTVVAREQHYHPIKDFISAERWDGVERLATLFVDWLGAEDTPYTRAVTRISWTAAVARIYQPGVKYDYMPVLVGEQGIGKSFMLEIMAGHRWFANLEGFGGKEVHEKLQESWIFEVAELEAFRRAEEREIKSFITTTNDKFRASYGRRVTSHPRTSVLFGTTNESEFLTDPTGNRRFLPVVCYRTEGPDSFVELEQLVPQYWAEALHLWESGAVLEMPPAMRTVARNIQEDQYSSDLWESIIEEYVLKGDFEELTIPEVWIKVLGGATDQVQRYHTERIKKCLNRIGWKKGLRKRTEYGHVSVYTPPQEH